MNELVSVIVPVYNVALYLDRCISSIVNQTYRNIELILINDGSTDKSGEQCISWQSRDERIKYYCQENAGVSAARNLGLDHAAGQFITFVDADDYIESRFCEKMVETIEQACADVVFCERIESREDGTIITSGSDDKKIVTISGEEYEYYGRLERREVWGALYRNRVLANIRFDRKIANGEDALFLAKAIRGAKRIAYYNEPMYCYVRRKESAYNGAFSEKKYTEIDAWLQIVDVFDQGTPARISADAACAQTAICMIGRYAGDPGFEKEHIERLIRIYRSKQLRLIQFDLQKKCRILKHIMYGLFPHILAQYWKWKNEKRHRNSNDL